MPDTLQLVLQCSMEDVLEKMFFIRDLGNASDNGASPEEMIARLRFNGDPSGSLTLRVSRVAARSISADFLGEDEGDLSDDQVGEVVCELANMICGSVLSRVESAVTFRLGAPQLSAAPDAPGDGTEVPGERAVHYAAVAGGTVTAVVNTESPVCTEKSGY